MSELELESSSDSDAAPAEAFEYVDLPDTGLLAPPAPATLRRPPSPRRETSGAALFLSADQLADEPSPSPS